MLPNSKPRRSRNSSERGQLVSTEHFTQLRCICNSGTLSEKVKANNMKILDTNMIFARAMVLQCSQRNYDTDNIMAHELARRPASMFDDRGAIKVAKTELFFKTNLKVDLARRQAEGGWMCSTLGRAIAFMRNLADILNIFRRHNQLSGIQSYQQYVRQMQGRQYQLGLFNLK